MPDGLLILDKPPGPTSHDVVARVRRVLQEARIGHTGTLDPMASGLLLLVVGKATRLAKFLSASDKSYDASVRLGFATDTADAQGRPLGPPSDRPMPSRGEIDAALEAFRGTFLQQPPAFSAKKIDGQRSYKLARARARTAHAAPVAPTAAADLRAVPDLAAPAVLSALPAAVSVTAHGIRLVSLDGDSVTLQVDCSAGFYIRSLAHDLGGRLGIGAHLTALRRTRVGDFALGQAMTLETMERDPQGAAAALVPLAAMLPRMPSVVLTADGVNRAAHGHHVGPAEMWAGQPSAPCSEPSALVVQPADWRPHPFVKLLDPLGDLVAVAQPAGAGGLLHPSIVLV